MSPLFPAEAFSEVITTNTPEWVMATTVGEESLEYWYFKPILWHGPQQLLWFKQEGNGSRRCIFKLQIWLWDTTQEHEYHLHHEGLVIQKQFFQFDPNSLFCLGHKKTLVWIKSCFFHPFSLYPLQLKSLPTPVNILDISNCTVGLSALSFAHEKTSAAHICIAGLFLTTSDLIMREGSMGQMSIFSRKKGL